MPAIVSLLFLSGIAPGYPNRKGADPLPLFQLRASVDIFSSTSPPPFTGITPFKDGLAFFVSSFSLFLSPFLSPSLPLSLSPSLALFPLLPLSLSRPLDLYRSIALFLFHCLSVLFSKHALCYIGMLLFSILIASLTILGLHKINSFRIFSIFFQPAQRPATVIFALLITRHSLPTFLSFTATLLQDLDTPLLHQTACILTPFLRFSLCIAHYGTHLYLH